MRKVGKKWQKVRARPELVCFDPGITAGHNQTADRMLIGVRPALKIDAMNVAPEHIQHMGCRQWGRCRRRRVQRRVASDNLGLQQIDALAQGHLAGGDTGQRRKSQGELLP